MQRCGDLPELRMRGRECAYLCSADPVHGLVLRLHARLPAHSQTQWNRVQRREFGHGERRVCPGACQGIFPQCRLDNECDDSNVCNGTETCEAFSCLAGSALICPLPTQCTTSSCNPASGCQVALVPDGTPCDDDDHFTGNDICSAGTCTGEVLECSQAQCEDGDFFCLLQRVLLQLVGQIDPTQPRPCN